MKIRTLILATVLCTASAGFAVAQTSPASPNAGEQGSDSSKPMDCTDANMMKVNSDMTKMAAGEKKTMGMKEMTMAKEMMGKKDMAGCKMHMNNAMGMAK
jgi:hypothetical protein